MSAPSAEPVPAIDAGPVIEAEDDTWTDTDSAFGGSAGGTKTDSISSSILSYRKENGRTYHAYKDGKYLAPNDEEEMDRLDLQHHLFCLTFGGKLLPVPIPEGQPLHRVLDVGTGTGIWAIDFADAHPESEVLGIDLSPTQPSLVPPNLTFQVDDIEEPWTFSTKFDLIHSRFMVGSLSNWPQYFSNAFAGLQPGGWMQVIEGLFPYESHDGTLLPNSPIDKWTTGVIDGLKLYGRPVNRDQKAQMISAGFENVQEKIYQWPLNRWPKDKRMKELGAWTNENISGGLHGLSIGIFTRALGWSAEEVEAFLIDVRKDMNDTRIHAWAPVLVVVGQKPKTA